jgi:hypothetical protein
MTRRSKGRGNKRRSPACVVARRAAEAHSLGQGFDAARLLGQLLDQFDPVGVAERFGNLGQRRPDGSGGSAACHGLSLQFQSFN